MATIGHFSGYLTRTGFRPTTSIRLTWETIQQEAQAFMPTLSISTVVWLM